MIERILVPLDGSELAAQILAQVRRILFFKDAQVILVRAVPEPRGVEGDTVEFPQVLMSQATKYLDELARELTAQGARVQAIVRQGYPAQVILDVAAEEKATLIAMSTHGRTGIDRWTFGSVTEKILRASRIPVLAVHSFEGRKKVGPAELAFEKILVPISTSELSLEVVAPALEFARLFGSHVVLLNVCNGMECTIPVPQITEAFARFREAGVSVEPLMKQGDPAAEILDTCRGQKAGLIAMTTHGRTGPSRWMLGSVTEKVLRNSVVPLLVVRPQKAPAGTRRSTREHEESKA